MPSVNRASIITCFALTFVCTLWGQTSLSFSQSRLPFASLQSGQYSDTLRALIVFAKFKDDNYPGDPAVFHREWPLFDNPGQLPLNAPSILSPDPRPPYPDSSLTAYFYDQSLGNFIIYGHAYDSVLVTAHNESNYHKPYGGYGDLTMELLDRIDSYGFDFSNYDHNRDGYIDYIFVVLRGDSKRDRKVFAWTGASCLDGRCTGTTLLDGGRKENPVYDGKILDWNRSGSYIMHRTPGNVSAFHYYIRLMAHEIGHDLWAQHFVHIPDNRKNDVPAQHNRGRFRDCVGYVLMAGAGGAWDCGGSETISAYERDLLGWIDCLPLTDSSVNNSIRDLYTTSECFTIELSQPQTKLYLSNLQHINFFDQQRDVGNEGQFQIGLRTSGLLIHLVRGRGVDVIPADNTLALSTTHDAYHGDLFGPGSSEQITPWTRPNSNGYTMYPENYQPDWIAIDNIKEAEKSNKALAFDFYTDFRLSPVIREDSWMGQETSGYVFENSIRVVDMSTLHIASNIGVSRNLIIETGSTVTIGPDSVLDMNPGSVLDLRPGSTLLIEGTLISNGLISRSPGAEIIVLEQGVIRSALSIN